ncbi:FAD-binding domain-containing protein [Chloroflexus aggregans]|uniref:DNA photolyase FAD-binding n=1 Tax=Chloroflexus aggregans (strain MD-66 / DSM 9485) TaxID=326427 RepID=B8G9X6_CHLAD|nr:FAD-binding domain-containing protein [Chloroflexus aggregans]ACL24491.1 DNA photolyase FAD-binding [Chloroflexus aggregans DSM 9485]
MQLRTDLTTRTEQAAYLADALAGLYQGPATPSPIRGGRWAALRRLRAFDVRNYARTRNDVARRTVSQLSPYLRHGVLTLAEVRDSILNRFGHTPDTEKFVNELAWRAFWQIVYAHLGERIHHDLEPAKHRSRVARRSLPPEVLTATTGLVCIDESLQELYTTGYMHNHARMWVAAYLQHWLGVDWREGADLFYRHLLDGDPASNSLSWQWVGSTFSHKPYIFNRQNVERFSGGTFCNRCPLANGGCPFDESYEQLARRLFGVTLAELEGRR